MSKKKDLDGEMISQGTTPRRLTDLIGSLCDLTSGSGDGNARGIYPGYFDNSLGIGPAQTSGFYAIQQWVDAEQRQAPCSIAVDLCGGEPFIGEFFRFCRLFSYNRCLSLFSNHQKSAWRIGMNSQLR